VTLRRRVLQLANACTRQQLPSTTLLNRRDCARARVCVCVCVCVERDCAIECFVHTNTLQVGQERVAGAVMGKDVYGRARRGVAESQGVQES
jgi:hypothetical protein